MIESPEHLEYAAKINHFIRSQIEQYNLTVRPKLDTAGTARVIRLYEKDGVNIGQIWATLTWAWQRQFSDGTVYGAVLTSPEQWRHKDKFNKAIDHWKMAMRKEADAEIRKGYDPKPKPEITPAERLEIDAEAQAELSREFQAWRLRNPDAELPDAELEGKTDYAWIFSDGTTVDRRN